MTATAVGPRYMQRFRCIGDACEDQCCSGWTVRLSPEDRTRMAAFLGESVLQAFTRSLEGDDDGLYMEMRPNGSCVALREDGLCTLQKMHGQEVLCGVCATYPRTVVRTGPRLELAASVACPEIARLLLFDDAALDLVDLSGQVSEELIVVDGVDDLEERRVLLSLLRARSWPLSVRVLAMASMVESGGGPSAAFFEQAAESLLKEPADELMAMNIAVSVLLGRLQRWSNPRFKDLVIQAMATYSTGQQPFEPSREDLPRMLQLYQARRDFWTVLAPESLDRMFTNYLANYWLVGQPQGGEETARMRRLLALYSMQRLLFFSHPMLTQASELAVKQGELGRLEDPAVVQNLVETAAVAVMYNLTRNIEHAHRFLRDLDFLMACESTSGRPALLGMAKF